MTVFKLLLTNVPNKNHDIIIAADLNARATDIIGGLSECIAKEAQ